MTDRAFVRHAERASALGDLDDLGDNLVGLDNANLRTRSTNAQALALADVAE